MRLSKSAATRGCGAWTTRLLFALIVFLIPGCPILLYPILWILMPAAERVDPTAAPSSTTPLTPAA